MLERIAEHYIYLSQDELRGLGFLFFIVGGILSRIAGKADVKLKRTPYFAYSCLIFLLLSAAQLIWVQSVPAITGGYLWLLMTIDIGASVVGGFFYGKVAMARSLDAYGGRGMAVLGFIPLLNLLLLFKPSQHANLGIPASTIRVLTGNWGVLIGTLALFAGSAIPGSVSSLNERIALRARSNPSAVKAAISLMIRSKGLAGALHTLSTEVRTPVKIDSVTTLSRIEVSGTEFRRIYIVSVPNPEISSSFRTEVVDKICSYAPYSPLLAAGATVHEVYTKADGSTLLSVLVTKDTCGLSTR